MVLKRYILREHVNPFFISLLVVTFILLIDRVIDLLNTIIEKKLDFATVMQVFGLSMPFMLALSIPMAVLVATILYFGRMTVDRETIAMKASGINIYRMIGPLMIVAVLLTGGMMYFNHFTLPETNHKLKNLMLKIAYYKPMTIVKPGEFTNVADYTIFVKENLKTELRGIIIFDRTETRFPRTIYAKSGKISQMDNGNSLEIILNDGEMHERDDKEQGKYQARTFTKYVLYIRNLGSRIDFTDTDYRSDREMTARALLSDINNKQNEINQKQKQIADFNRRINVIKLNPVQYDAARETNRLNQMKKLEQDRLAELQESADALKVEYHKKFALAFAIIIFVLIGIPLGLMTRSSGIGMAFSVSSFIFLIYYVALNGGEQLADKGYMSPFLSMWISNFIFLIIAILLIIGSIYEKRLIDLHTLGWKLSHKRGKKAPIPDEVIH
jgi:lipopolysaccharide export system permease protein